MTHPNQSRWAAVIGQAATAATTAAALAFVTGNLVLYLRSWFERFPWSSLDQDFSVTNLEFIGASVLLPTLFVSISWTLLAFTPMARAWAKEAYSPTERAEPRRFRRVRGMIWYDREPRHRRRLIAGVGVAVSVALALSTPLLIWARGLAPQNHDLYRSSWGCFAAVALAAAVFSTLAAVLLPRIMSADGTASRRLYFTIVTTLVILPPAIGILATSPFPPTLVCTKDHDSIRGVLIGTTSTTTFVGVFPAGGVGDSGDRSVATLPNAERADEYSGGRDSRCLARSTAR